LSPILPKNPIVGEKRQSGEALDFNYDSLLECSLHKFICDDERHRSQLLPVVLFKFQALSFLFSLT
jgi:hypothetical protein